MSPTLYMLYYSAMNQYLEVEFSVQHKPCGTIPHNQANCIMLSRHSGISQVKNTSISVYGNCGYMVGHKHAFVSVEKESAFA